MIKLIHTSDWHLGLRFCGYDPSYEYELFFKQLTKTVVREKPDALLIAGDVFDIPIPASELLERFEQCLKELHEACKTMQIIITSGNHDDSQWLEKQTKRWSEWGVHIIGQLRKRDTSYDIGRHIITIPNADGDPKGYIIGMPYMTSTTCPVLSEQIPTERRLPTFMTAHCFVLRERLPGVERQKATMVLEDLPLDHIDYLALGHAHSSKNIGSNKVRCCGSPWPITPKDFQRRSFSVVTIESRNGEVKVSERWVKSQCPLILLPKKPARIDTVLKQLAAFPEEEQAFINLNVRAESGTKEKEFIKQCKEISTGKKARLCSVVWVQGDNMRFTNIADTSYLSYGQSLSSKKTTELPELVADLQKSLNAQLTQLDKVINDLHRKEDVFTDSVNTLRTQLRNLNARKLLRQDYAKVKDEANYLQALMEEPQYRWEEDMLERYKESKQTNSANGVNGEIYISSGSIGVALLLQSLDKGNHILDVVCSLTYHLRSFNVQRLLVGKECISVELSYIPYTLSCLTASFSKLVLSIISVSCKVTHIGDVHYMLHTISCFLKSLVKDIFKDECSEVSDMRIVVDCRSATVHTDLSFFNRYEILHLAVHCVIQLHAKYLLPVINTVLAIIDNFPIS